MSENSARPALRLNKAISLVVALGRVPRIGGVDAAALPAGSTDRRQSRDLQHGRRKRSQVLLKNGAGFTHTLSGSHITASQTRFKGPADAGCLIVVAFRVQSQLNLQQCEVTLCLSTGNVCCHLKHAIAYQGTK